MPDHPPLYVINLPRHAERRARMTLLLREQRLSPQFVEAVDGSRTCEKITAFWHANAQRRMLNPGEIGCMMSHIQVWRRIVGEDLPRAVVLEDDICLSPAFADVVRGLDDMGPFNLLRLETDLGQAVMETRASGTAAGHTGHRLLRGAYRCGGYMIARDAAALLLSASESFRHAVDVEMFDRRRSTVRSLTVHQLVPGICMQAELHPSLADQAPYLRSSIGGMGARADTVQGLKRGGERPVVTIVRRWLRPVKQFAINAMLLPFGRHRCPVPFAVDN
jgi:glycosyl transferase family 25